MNSELYQTLIVALLVTGLIPALIFLGQHRPKQWKRVAAWDASGLIIVIALWYIRSIILIIMRWPGSIQPSLADAIVALVLLAVIDGLLILRLVSYRAFIERDRRNSIDQ